MCGEVRKCRHNLDCAIPERPVRSASTDDMIITLSGLDDLCRRRRRSTQRQHSSCALAPTRSWRMLLPRIFTLNLLHTVFERNGQLRSKGVAGNGGSGADGCYRPGQRRAINFVCIVYSLLVAISKLNSNQNIIVANALYKGG